MPLLAAASGLHGLTVVRMHPASADANLTVKRPRLALLDVARSYRVVLDGREIARLRNGEQKTFLVEPGAHVVQLRIDWTGSPPLMVQVPPSATVTVAAEPRGNLFSRQGYLRLTEQ